MSNKNTLDNLQYGPLNKSVYTQQLELVIKSILHCPEKVRLYPKFENNTEQLHAFIEVSKAQGFSVDVSTLLSKANFSHLHLDQADSTQYQNTFSYHQHHEYEDDEFDLYTYYEQFHTPKGFESLNAADIDAIRSYTGSSYYDINSLLYGHLHNHYFYSNSEYFKTPLIQAAFVASGLNKIEPTLEDFDTYRGDMPGIDGINTRIELIEQGDGLDQSEAFFSTSKKFTVADNFSWDGVLIHFDAPYGKDISALSYFSSEEELLLPPSTIYWDKHEIINGKHVFHAKVIAPLIEGADDVSIEQMKNFIDLMDWAEQQSIDTSFITPYTWNKINEFNTDFAKQPALDEMIDSSQIQPQNEPSNHVLKMSDCISEPDLLFESMPTDTDYLSQSNPTDHQTVSEFFSSITLNESAVLPTEILF